tara:strand:+ start:370 stop:786 length:417 start_codon:yes stop_codon:yes gene_type:complete
MADKKVTQLTSLTSPVSADLLLIIDDAGGTPVSKQITVKNLAGALPNTSVSTLTTSANTTLAGSNTVVSSNVNITGTRGPQITANWIKLGLNSGSISNNATTQLGGGQQGAIFVDDEYIYVATSNTVVKRVALSVFSS